MHSKLKTENILGVSRTVFVLGVVSLLTDVSSEMLVPIIPQFLKFAVGASMLNIGLIEGVAECVASVLRVYAGYLADKFGKPKLLTVIGYGLSALSKPFYLPAHTWPQVLGIRFSDRFGKGIRSAPRDVLIADTTPDDQRGRAFGLHRAMDTTGAMLGPIIIAVLVMVFFGREFLTAPGEKHRSVYQIIFLAAAVPAVLGWLALVFFVPERRRDDSSAKKPELKLSALDKRFRIFLAIVFLFSVGNSSDAFLVVRATSKPISMGLVEFLWVYALFNGLSAVVALSSGIISDKLGRRPVLIVGWLIFSLVYFAMARITTATQVWIWFAIYGAYYGMTEGMLRAYAVDLAPAHLRGTAVGAYFTFTGIALLPASLRAGILWDRVGPAAPFYYGAATSLLAAVLLGTLIKSGPRT